MESTAQSVGDNYLSAEDQRELSEAHATLAAIRELAARSHEVVSRLQESVFAPDKIKRLNVRFSISQAAEMVSRTTTAIRDAERSRLR